MSHPATVYKDWHWGLKPTQVIDWKDPDVPDPLVEIGRLLELHLRQGKNRFVLTTDKQDVDTTHLAFDPAHVQQRLYLLIPQPYRRAVRRLIDPEGGFFPLSQMAANCPETTQGTGYPAVRAQYLGHLTNITYLTHKKGDGVSQYIHEFGEEDEAKGDEPRLPVVMADTTGRLWVVGGAYTCPNPGITN